MAGRRYTEISPTGHPYPGRHICLSHKLVERVWARMTSHRLSQTTVYGLSPGTRGQQPELFIHKGI